MFDWLSYLADLLVYRLIGLDEATSLGKAVHFFVYDVAKVLILLLFISGGWMLMIAARSARADPTLTR